MAEPNTSSPRNLALDNLRVVAMLLGLVVHGVLPYTATGIVRFPIRDCSRHPVADACYFAVHDFRMQLFFLLAGFAACALVERRGIGGLVRNRLARIGLPLVFAVLIICPCMHLLFAHHTAARNVEWNPVDCGGWVGPNFHLWFLYYLILCCVPFVVFLTLSRHIPRRIAVLTDLAVRRFIPWRGNVLVLSLIGIPLLWDMPSWWIETPGGWAPDLTIFLYYLGFFAAGTLLYRHRDLLRDVGRRWPLQLVIANFLVLPVMLKATASGNWAEDAVRGPLPAWMIAWKAGAIFLGGLYTWLTVGGLIGLFQRYFAGTSRTWRYLAESSYWCYLAGFPVQTVLQVWLAPQRMPIVVEFVIVNILTFATLLVSYEFFVRHMWIGLLLNGKRPGREPTPAVVIATRLPVPQDGPQCEREPRAVTPKRPRRQLTFSSSHAG